MNAVLSFARMFTGSSEAPFKRTKIGWVLVVLNLFMTVLSINFFMGMLKTNFEGWLMMNTCAPSIFLFVLGFLLGSPAVMIAGSLAMFCYGTLGLFVFSWSGGNLVAQAAHILMTAAVVYTVVDVVCNRRWKSSLAGTALGIVLLVPFTIVQDAWCKAHADVVEKLFLGTLTLTLPE